MLDKDGSGKIDAKDIKILFNDQDNKLPNESTL
jgi:hypothetical protein